MINTIYAIQSFLNQKKFLIYKDCSSDLLNNKKFKVASVLVIYTH